LVVFFYNLFTLNLFHVLQEKKTYDPLYVPNKITWPCNDPLWTQRQLLTYNCWIAIGPKGQCGSPSIGQVTSLWLGRPLHLFLIILMITCKLWRPIGKFEVCHCWSLILANICFLSTQASPTKLQWQSWNNYASIKLPIVLTPTLNVLIGAESLKSYVKFFLQLKDIFLQLKEIF